MNIEFKSQLVQLSRVRLHVMTAGKEEGPLLIFLHGFPEFWESFRRQMEYFSTLGYRVLAPDQRGYNLSEKPKGVLSYQIDYLAQDVVDLIDWAEGKKAILVGHDWGAAVAWWVAIKFPERLKKLVILNVPHPQVMKKNLLSNGKQLRKSWYIFFFQIPFLPEWYLSHKDNAKLVASLMGTSRPGTFGPDVLKRYQESWKRPGAVSSMVNWYRTSMRKRLDLTKEKRVYVPTLIIWGKQDRFLGAEMAEQSLHYCDQAHLEWIQEASHWVHHEEIDQVNQLLEKFIADCS